MFFNRYKPVSLILLATLLTFKLAAQDNNAFAAADTSEFSINIRDGWKLFNSYVGKFQQDTVVLELILQHNNNIDFSREQYIGKIKRPAFIPVTEKNTSCSLVVSSYSLRIDKEGKCYLRLVAGVPPQQDPSVIPLKFVFQNQ